MTGAHAQDDSRTPRTAHAAARPRRAASRTLGDTPLSGGDRLRRSRLNNGEPVTRKLARSAAFTLVFLGLAFASAGPAHANSGTSSSAAGAATPVLPAIVAACSVSGPAALACMGVVGIGVACYMYCDGVIDVVMDMATKGGHRKNARKSTKDKHEKADVRRKRDQERKRRREGR